MSEKALRDLNIQPISDKNSEFSSKGVLEKSPVEAENENVKEMNHAKPASLVSSVPSKDAKTLDPGAANGNVEIEYIESENLHQLEDVDAILSVLALLVAFRPLHGPASLIFSCNVLSSVFPSR